MWVLTLGFGAILLAPPNLTPVSTYAGHWFAVALVLVAVLGRRHSRAALAAAGLAGLAGLGFAAWELFRLARGADASDWAFVVGGLIVAGSSLAQLVARLRHEPRFDPVLLAALQLYVGEVAVWVYYLINGAALNYRNYAPETLITPFRVEVPFMALALAAVGLGITRSAPAALDRLGLKTPRWWQLALGLLIAQLFLLGEHPINVLTKLVTPAQYHAIAWVSYTTYSNLPWWAYLTFAIGAGVSEETLFRGAVQPRLGIIATAFLFAVGHVQYGFTPILAGVFVHGIVYGMLRRYLNTTTSIVTHASYDFGAYLAPGPTTYWIVAVLMVAALVVPAMRNRRVIYEVLRAGLRNDWIGMFRWPRWNAG